MREVVRARALTVCTISSEEEADRDFLRAASCLDFGVDVVIKLFESLQLCPQFNVTGVFCKVSTKRSFCQVLADVQANGLRHQLLSDNQRFQGHITDSRMVRSG